MKILKYMAKNLFAFFKSHKIISGLVVLVVIGGVHYEWKKSQDTSGETRYVTALAQKGNIITSITGSGQVSTLNQLDLKPKVSGDLLSVSVTNGQKVKAGMIVAQINAKDALKSVRDSEVNLESAKLSLAKLQQPPDQLSLLQSQNSIDRAKETKTTAQNDLLKSYDSAYNSVADTFSDLPTLMSDIHDMLYTSTNSLNGNSSQLNIDYYTSESARTDFSKANQLKDEVHGKYQITAQSAYDKNLIDYKSTTRASDQNTIENLLDETYATARSISEAIKSEINLIQFYQDTVKALGQKPATLSSTQIASLNSYATQINSHLDALLAAKNAIQNDKDSIVNADRTIAENTASLTKLQSGTDPLDIKSANLTIQQRQNSLIDAQTTLADYTIRAQFDGVIAVVNSKKGDTVGNSTVVATLVTEQKIAQISLNEVDAAKVAVGQKVTITFDAIADLSITGEVAQLDTLGTVSQGVVSYNVTIKFDTQDDRVKPGMSVSAAIITNVKQNVIMVANSAIKNTGNTQYVEMFTPALGEQSRSNQGVVSTLVPTEHVVTTGLSNDTDTEITSGLSEGDEIVVRTITPQTKTTAQTAPSLFGNTGSRSLGNTNRAVTR